MSKSYEEYAIDWLYKTEDLKPGDSILLLCANKHMQKGLFKALNSVRESLLSSPKNHSKKIAGEVEISLSFMQKQLWVKLTKVNYDLSAGVLITAHDNKTSLIMREDSKVED